jgi:uncharacterized membrane protein
MTETRSAADRLFGDATSTDGPAATTPAPDVAPPRTAADMAATLFENSSARADTSVPWTTNAVERDLFGAGHQAPTEVFPPETALREALRARERDVMEVLQLGQNDRVTRHREFVSAIRDSGLDAATTGQQLYHPMTDAEIAAAHGEEPDPRKEAAVVEGLNRGLITRYGAERGERPARAVGTYLEQHPRLPRVLTSPGVTTRVGFGPVFESLIEHVRVQGHV